MRTALWSILLGLFVYSDISIADDPLPPTSAFLILNEEGREIPPKLSQTEFTPFGMLIGLSGTNASLCSATHLVSNKLLTAAHCFKNLAEWKYYIVFYGKDKQKHLARVEKLLFVGRDIDIAIAQIPSDTAANWDEAGVEARGLASLTQKNTAFDVTLWSFSPLNNFPLLKAQNPGKIGMVYRPNNCLASLNRPQIEIRDDGDKTVGVLPMLHHMKAEQHLFIDKCKYQVVQGNSGSLVTLSFSFSDKLGVAAVYAFNKESFWGWPEIQILRETHKKVTLHYRGLTNETKQLEFASGDFSVAAAPLLSTLQKSSPELFQ